MKKVLSALILIPLFSLNSFSQTDHSKLLYREEGRESAYPRLSKDKKKILFQSNRDGKWQLYILEISTGGITQLTTEGNNNFPDWNADNNWIAFVSDRDGNEEIYLMKNDGSNAKQLTNDPGRDIHPYFSPDGKQLLFNSTRGNESFDIYRYLIETGKTERITGTDDNETCARYSPDMKQIVFLKNNEESDDIFVVNTSGMQSENLTVTPEKRDGWPMFSADGQWIYYSGMEAGIYAIYRIKTDGSNKQQLTFPKTDEEDARAFISADGTLLIYNKRIGKTIEIRQLEILPN